MVETLESPPRPKIGLALGSGVARGWAHLGVLRALERYGFGPDVVAGTSIGAMVGGAYLAGHAETLEDWARALNKVRIISYLDFRVRSGGMIGGRHLVQAMQEHLGDTTIEALRRPFVAVATDLVTGHEVWLRKGNLIEAIRTSFSLPGVFPPVRMNGRWMVDGALVNPVPVSICQALGAQMVIAVNVNADIIGKSRRGDQDVPSIAGFDLLQELEAGKTMAPESKLGALTRRVFRREPSQPSLFGVMISALGIVQDRITRSRLAGEPPDVHITPRLGHIGLFEFDRADEIIDEGEAAVERALPDLRDALAVLGHDLNGNGNGGR
ncbi:MAG: patatin-like phospholipase family protein [Proteobacteria bacterium]|nr:patatin-like phospholipase family protein [Pseudomonadota bacterium]